MSNKHLLETDADAIYVPSLILVADKTAATDASAAMQTLITALGLGGGDIVVPVGDYLWGSAIPTIPKALTGKLRVRFEPGCTITLTNAAPGLFRMASTSQYDELRNVEIDGGGAWVDATGVTTDLEARAAVFGSFDGATPNRVTWGDIRVRGFRGDAPIGGSSGGKRGWVVIATANDNVGTTVEINDVYVEDIKVTGLRAGVIISGQLGVTRDGSTFANITQDQTHIHDCEHDTKNTSGTFSASNNFHMGQDSDGGHYCIKRSRGYRAGDMGIETNTARTTLVQDAICEEAVSGNIYHVNFRPGQPTDRIDYVRCNPARRVKTVTAGDTHFGRGYWFDDNLYAGVPDGPTARIVLSDCGFEKETTDAVGVSGLAVYAVNAARVELHRFTPAELGGIQASNVTAVALDLIHLTRSKAGTSTLITRGLRPTYRMSRTGSANLRVFDIRLTGDTTARRFVLDQDDTETDAVLTGIAAGNHWSTYLGQGVFAGRAEGFRWRQETGDTAARTVNADAAATIEAPFVVDRIDLTNASAGQLIVNAPTAVQPFFAPSGDTPLGGRFVPAWYYGPQFGSASSAAVVQNTLHATPFIVSAPTGLTISSMSVEVTVLAASSTVRLGIYRVVNGQPTTLVVDLGTVDSSTTGVKTISGLTQFLPRGVYALAAVAQGGTPTLNTVAGMNPMVGSPGNTTSGNAAAWSITGVSGALPSPFGTPAGANYAIRAVLRAAS